MALEDLIKRAGITEDDAEALIRFAVEFLTRVQQAEPITPYDVDHAYALTVLPQYSDGERFHDLVPVRRLLALGNRAWAQLGTPPFAEHVREHKLPPRWNTGDMALWCDGTHSIPVRVVNPPPADHPASYVEVEVLQNTWCRSGGNGPTCTSHCATTGKDKPLYERGCIASVAARNLLDMLGLGPAEPAEPV